MTRVLVLWPPHVPSYFNAGHHLPVFAVAAYLRASGGRDVRTMDAGALNATWREICTVLVDGDFDVVLVMNEFDTFDAVVTTVRHVRTLAPRAKIGTFGRLSSEAPMLFDGVDLDGVVADGDYEAGVRAFLEHVEGKASLPLPGVRVRAGSGEWRDAAPGLYLDADEWAFPDVTEIPYDAYHRLYSDDSNKFCGIPDRRELVVPVARGCPVGCSYCEVPRQQGLRERRRSVASVVAYMLDAFENHPFEYASMYAPTFTLNRRWVVDMCDAVEALPRRIPWKCVTTIRHLDAELVERMGRAHCVRISIGLETLDEAGKRSLPMVKRASETSVEALAAWCRDARVELNCFVILGLPGQSVEGARATIAKVRALGARVRPTIYTPYERIAADPERAMQALYDRKLFVEDEPGAEAFYEMAFSKERRPTTVMERIARAAGS
jgi:radical SAM superfamily enzyme YgiQ (UPF0313 family)